ncbi:MAG: DUF5343 domain-containing protein [Chloroflexi bacterium]|nr:DUF5343 domain-containing protein [Chloroflexota bacterium]
MARRTRNRIPPYGPAQGVIAGLQLLQRLTPSRVDEGLLRAHGVAPGNEYKVVEALHFLGLIDEEGRPTDGSLSLKTRGPTYILALQDILRQAYNDLFRGLNLKEASREAVYNYFVTQERLGAEMATKATRCFLALCHLGQVELSSGLLEVGSRRGTRRGKTPPTPQPRQKKDAVHLSPIPPAPPSPFILAITPEMAEMDEERLTAFLKRLRRALNRAATD